MQHPHQTLCSKNNENHADSKQRSRIAMCTGNVKNIKSETWQCLAHWSNSIHYWTCSVLRATADKVLLKSLTQFCITGCYERPSWFLSLPSLKKMLMVGQSNAQLHSVWMWMCEVTYYTFSFTYKPVISIQKSLYRRSSVYPSPYYHINATDSIAPY
jgi:hypothetical protein